MDSTVGGLSLSGESPSLRAVPAEGRHTLHLCVFLKPCRADEDCTPSHLKALTVLEIVGALLGHALRDCHLGAFELYGVLNNPSRRREIFGFRVDLIV